MNIKSPRYTKPPRYVRGRRLNLANVVRCEAKARATGLIAKHRYGDAYELMVAACERARDIEFIRDH